MKKGSLRERYHYWFDNRMANGSLGLIRVLLIATVIAVILVAVGLVVFASDVYDSFSGAFWNSIATVINSWMPYYEEGGTGYLIFTSLAAIFGLLLASVLIGIISSAIEDKVNDLKRGNSIVLEKGHTIILGFTPGEYALINQLILSAADKRECILVACDLEREETERYIHDNVKVPKNIKLICRTVDIYDPTDLQKCSICNSRSIIISPTNDRDTLKILLSISTATNHAEKQEIHVAAITTGSDFRLPNSIISQYNVSTLQTNEILSKIIAHSCTQQGLSETFTEIFNYEGNELYADSVPGSEGLSFGTLLVNLRNAVPIGILRNGDAILAPDANELLRKDDRIIVFEETGNAFRFFAGKESFAPSIVISTEANVTQHESVVIVGSNECIGTVITELPENVDRVILNAVDKKHLKIIEEVKAVRPEISISIDDHQIHVNKDVPSFILNARHIVLLNSHTGEDEDSDLENILRIINLRDIRERYKLNYNITVELRSESNRKLIEDNDSTDFVVASDLSSLFLAQLSENPELNTVFNELLSNRGCELFLKDATALCCTGERKVAELRANLLQRGYVFLGYILSSSSHSIYSLNPFEKITLSAGDRLIVIGED